MPNSKIKLSLNVMILEQDFYANRALNSFLAWDRRTRVIALAQTVDEAFEWLDSVTPFEHPRVLVLDVSVVSSPEDLSILIHRFRNMVKDLLIICLAYESDPRMVMAAFRAGAKGYFIRNELRLKLVGAILAALDHRFITSEEVLEQVKKAGERLPEAEILASEREFPEMTDRIRQAIWLCVVEGMPAHLAANEMGISPHTIRSYIKEGYRILEMYDSDMEFPEDVSPLERAYLRFTGLEFTPRNNEPVEEKSPAAEPPQEPPPPEKARKKKPKSS